MSVTDAASRRRACAAACAWVAALGFFAPCAAAHTLSVTRGTATIEAGVLVLEFSVSGDELEHQLAPSHSDHDAFAAADVRRAAADFATELLDRIVVRGEQGETISGRVAAPTWSPPIGGVTLDHEQLPSIRALYRLTYPLVGTPGHLSLQQKAAPQAHASPSQIVLATRLDGFPPRTLCLTGGGNVEVLPLAQAHRAGSRGVADDPCDTEAFVLDDAYRAIRIVLRIDPDGLRLMVYMPVPILETWVALPRAHGDYFEPSEQTRVSNEFMRLLSSHFRLSVDGQPRPVQFEQGGLLDVGDTTLRDPDDARRVDAHTARAFAMTHDSVASPRRVNLESSLFNSAVLTSEVLIVTGGACEERDLSTYRPQLTWSSE